MSLFILTGMPTADNIDVTASREADRQGCVDVQLHFDYCNLPRMPLYYDVQFTGTEDKGWYL